MEVIRRELQQPPCVPIYLPVFMLICSSFVLWLSMLLAKANLSPWALDLIASHLLKEIPTSYLINYFSSLLDHYYCLQICSYLSHIKIWSKNTFSSRYSPISHLPFIKKKTTWKSLSSLPFVPFSLGPTPTRYPPTCPPKLFFLRSSMPSTWLNPKAIFSPHLFNLSASLDTTDYSFFLDYFVSFTETTLTWCSS